MTNYRRNFIPGGSYFFTVNLADRQSDLLVSQIALLRAAVTYTKSRHPFKLDAYVILPDHMHAIWTLPAEDPVFSMRWRLIKGYFSRHLPHIENLDASRREKASAVSGKGAIGNIPCAMKPMSRGMSITFISTR